MSNEGKQERFIEAATIRESFSDPRTLQDRLSKNPEDEFSKARLFEVYKEKGRHEELIDLMLTEAEHAKSAKEAAGYLCDAAKASFEKKQFETAFDIWGLALKREPRNGAIHDRLDSLALQLGRVEILEKLYRNILAEVNDRMLVGLLNLRLACLFSIEEKFEDAKECMRKIVCVEDIDAQSIVKQCSVKATSADTQIFLSTLCKRVGETSEAKNALVRALHLELESETEVKIHLLLAGLYKGNGRIHDASQSLVEALRIDPTHLECAKSLAQLYDENNVPQKSLAVLNACKKARVATSLKTLSLDFGAKRWANSHEKAEALLTQFKNSLGDKDALSLHFKAAFASYELKNIEHALKHAKSAITIDSHYLPVLKLLPRLYLAKGDKVKASHCIGQVAEAEKSHGASVGQVASLFLEASVMALQAKDSALANHFVDKAMVLAPMDRDILECKTQLLLEEGNWVKAKANYFKNKAIENSEDQANHLVAFAKLMEVHAAQPGVVKELCQKALSLKPDFVEALMLLLSKAKEESNWPQAFDTLLKMAVLEKTEKRKIQILDSARGLARRLSSTEHARVLQCFLSERNLSPLMTKSMVVTLRELVANYDKDGQAQRIPDLYDWVLAQLPKSNPAKLLIENDRRHLQALFKNKEKQPVLKKHEVFVSSHTTLYTPKPVIAAKPTSQEAVPQGKKRPHKRVRFHAASTQLKRVESVLSKKPGGKQFGKGIAEISTVIVKRKATA